MQNDNSIKGVDYAKAAIDESRLHTKSRSARVMMARMASGPLGNYTPEAKALWSDYLAELEAK